MPRLRGRFQPPALLAASAGIAGIGFVIFAVARGRLIEPLVSMAVLGFGVGSFSSAMPAVILAVTPTDETSSAMGFNQVVRSVGFSIGSAVGGLILAANTESGHTFPIDSGYTTAAWIGVTLMAFTVVISLFLPRTDLPSRTDR
jgi:predicted MFS family arabinose efflux permease